LRDIRELLKCPWMGCHDDGRSLNNKRGYDFDGVRHYLRTPEPLNPATPFTPSPDTPFAPSPDTFAVSFIGFSRFVTASLALTCPLDGPSTA